MCSSKLNDSLTKVGSVQYWQFHLSSYRLLTIDMMNVNWKRNTCFFLYYLNLPNGMLNNGPGSGDSHTQCSINFNVPLLGSYGYVYFSQLWKIKCDMSAKHTEIAIHNVS